MFTLSSLKKYWREALIFILVVIVAISTKTCSNKNKEIQAKQSDIELLIESRDSAYNIAVYYHGRNGHLIGQVKTLTGTVKQITQYANQLGIDKKALEAQVGSFKNLVAFWKGKANAKDTFSTVGRDTTIIYRDKPEQAMVFVSKPTKFLELDQLYHPSDKSLSTVYQYNVEFSLTAYKKKAPDYKWYNKKYDIVTDIEFSDPSIKVGEFKGIVVKEEKKKQQPKIVTWLELIGFGFVFGALAFR